MSPEPFSRELGPQEALFIELNRLSCGGLQFISFVKVCEPLHVERLRESLAYIHKRHPFLRARVKRGERLRWVCDVKFEDIPIEIYPAVDQLDLEREFKDLATSCLNSEEHVYNLRFYVNKEDMVEWICIINIHATFDGRSVMTLFSDLDKLLCSDTKTDSSIKSLPLQDSIASQLEASGYYGEKVVEHENKQGLSWIVEQEAAPSERKACAISYLMPPDKVELLAQLAKREQVKLTALYCAVASVAARAIPACKSLNEVILAMDARQLCSPNIPIDHIGSFSETTSLKLPPNSAFSNVFEVAKILNDQIDLVLLKKRPMTKSLRLDYRMEDITCMAADITAKKNSFPAGIIVSNVGNMRLLADEMHYFEIRKPMITLNNGINPLMVVNYTTYRNSVFIFGYCEPLISKKSVSAYIDEFMSIIDELIAKFKY
ncbi:hypothetical protein ACJJIX_20595 [Microbulbifer sp. VAAC004]|uniref:hypothetical protein n=1 Tax=unclassified Microbulbifer TaxID=2619833 RepID=UPI00403A66F7